MSMNKRLEAIKEALETKHGDKLPIACFRIEGETDQEALKRLGLTKHPRKVIFMNSCWEGI